MVFTLWKSPSNSSGYNWTQVIQSTSNMKASATVSSQIKLHHTPALLVAVFLPCLVIIGWVSKNFTSIKKSCKWHKSKQSISNYKNSFVGIFLCSFYLNLAVQTSYRRAILRYESSTLIVYKERVALSFKVCRWVSESVCICKVSMSPVQISTMVNI